MHVSSPLAFPPSYTPSSESEAPFEPQKAQILEDDHDIVREILADGDHPFPIERPVLREVVEQKTGSSVTKIKFLSSGSFHKAFLMTLEDGRQLVARIARRYMPRLKTESEVATMNYIRTRTRVPVPTVLHFDSNEYNPLGGEYILMTVAPGIALSRVYHRLPPATLRALLRNLATHILELFIHRFPKTGSLYQISKSQFDVGPMVSWPFFGSGRGRQPDIDRGPWSSEMGYLKACAQREIDSVKKESEGRVASHRPHLPPDDESAPPSDDEESDEDIMYKDYRMKQRSSLLVAYAVARVEAVRDEMERFLSHMRHLGVENKDDEFAPFAIDPHDLSLANIFVDVDDHSKITCIIDWESTVIRPLWHCAHLPAFLHSPTANFAFATSPSPLHVTSPTSLISPFHHPSTSAADVFREEMGKLGPEGELWLRGEREREEWRRAHKVIEWDGWEEGLVGQVLGDEDSATSEASSYFVGFQ